MHGDAETLVGVAQVGDVEGDELAPPERAGIPDEQQRAVADVATLRAP